MIKSHQEFIESRHNLQREFRIRNIISCVFIGYLGYIIFNLLPLISPFYKLVALMSIVSLGLSLLILIIKLRFVYITRKGNEELYSYIRHVIAKSRLTDNYHDLNLLLDSKYSIHTILGMSRLPNDYYNFNHLSKWVKLPEALNYFRDNKIEPKDFYDNDKMSDYLKTVYPEFLKALAESQVSHQK